MQAQVNRQLTRREIVTGRIALTPQPVEPRRPDSIQAVLDSRASTANPWRARLNEVESRRARTPGERGRKATRITELSHEAAMWDAAKAAETAEADRVAALEQSGARENARKCAERLHTENAPQSREHARGKSSRFA